MNQAEYFFPALVNYSLALKKLQCSVSIQNIVELEQSVVSCKFCCHVDCDHPNLATWVGDVCGVLCIRDHEQCMFMVYTYMLFL
jgi:hypothetical protein